MGVEFISVNIITFKKIITKVSIKLVQSRSLLKSKIVTKYFMIKCYLILYFLSTLPSSYIYIKTDCFVFVFTILPIASVVYNNFLL